MRVRSLSIASTFTVLSGLLAIGVAVAQDPPPAQDPPVAQDPPGAGATPGFTPTPSGTVPNVPAVPGKAPVKPPAKKAASDTTQPTKRGTDREVGQMLYERSCWQCHGLTGAGDGPAAEALVGGVPSLVGTIRSVDAEKIENIDPLIGVLQEGKGRMPAYSEDIDRADSRRLLFYVRDLLEGKVGPEAPAEDDAADADAPAGDAPAEGQ